MQERQGNRGIASNMPTHVLQEVHRRRDQQPSEVLSVVQDQVLKERYKLN